MTGRRAVAMWHSPDNHVILKKYFLGDATATHENGYDQQAERNVENLDCGLQVVHRGRPVPGCRCKNCKTRFNMGELNPYFKVQRTDGERLTDGGFSRNSYTNHTVLIGVPSTNIDAYLIKNDLVPKMWYWTKAARPDEKLFYLETANLFEKNFRAAVDWEYRDNHLFLVCLYLNRMQPRLPFETIGIIVNLLLKMRRADMAAFFPRTYTTTYDLRGNRCMCIHEPLPPEAYMLFEKPHEILEQRYRSYVTNDYVMRKMSDPRKTKNIWGAKTMLVHREQQTDGPPSMTDMAVQADISDSDSDSDSDSESGTYSDTTDDSVYGQDTDDDEPPVQRRRTE